MERFKLNVERNFKLINLPIDGKERTVEIDTKEAWAVVEFEINGETVAVHEGNQIEFVTESGENVVGQVLKITGKGEKTKLQIMPIGADCEQIWKVVNIKTLKVIEV